MALEKIEMNGPDSYYEALLLSYAKSGKPVTITMRSGAVRRGIVIDVKHGLTWMVSIDGQGRDEGGGAHHLRIESIEVVSADIPASHPQIQSLKKSMS